MSKSHDGSSFAPVLDTAKIKVAQFKFYSTKRLSIVITVLSILTIVFHTYLLIGTLLITNNLFSSDISSTIADLIIKASSCSPALLITTFIAFLWWVYASHENLLALKDKTDHKSGWIIIEFFIPLYNWVAPCAGIKELYTKSFQTEELGIARIWQILWVTHFIFDLNLATNLFGISETSTFELNLLTIVLFFSITCILVDKITVVQYKRLAHDSTSSYL